MQLNISGLFPFLHRAVFSLVIHVDIVFSAISIQYYRVFGRRLFSIPVLSLSSTSILLCIAFPFVNVY